METLLVTLKNGKAKKLLEDLQELQLLEFTSAESGDKKIITSKLSDLKNRVCLPMDDAAINKQLEEIRNEWQPNI